MGNERKPVRESAPPYVVEPQVEVRISLSALFEAVERLGEDGLRQLRQWVDERLAALSAETNIREGKPGKTLIRFAGWIPPDDLALMQDAIESGCEGVDIDEW
jgi:hypothetical protein